MSFFSHAKVSSSQACEPALHMQGYCPANIGIVLAFWEKVPTSSVLVGAVTVSA